MSVESAYLNEIINKHNRTTNLAVVFADIEKYSERRSATQILVIDEFTTILKQTISEISKIHIDYAQANKLNFQTDIIIIPTGDGAAVIFAFDGLNDIHLSFAKELLRGIHTYNQKDKCNKFENQRWCNCHANFFVRIGIAEGKAIFYKDYNENYNVAGNVINIANRVMGKLDGGQIAFSEEAYRQLIDMVDDPNLSDNFREYANIEFKHRKKMNIFQYIGTDEEYINRNEPQDLYLMARAQVAQDKLKALGFPMADMEKASENVEPLIDMMEAFANLFSKLSTAPSQALLPPDTTNE